MKTLSAILAASALFIGASISHASATVGQQAKLTYQTVDGKTVDIEKLKGKIVVVDFWATWCGPCMAEAGHIVSIKQKYADKGLVMLGISLDSDKERMLSVAKQKGFDWPMQFDGAGWKNSVFKQWGTTFIPFTVIVDPTGKIVFADNPGAGLDAAIETTFKNTPPFVVDPAIVADALKVLDQAEEHLTNKDAKGALKLLSKVPPTAKSDEKFAERSKAVQKKLEEAGEAMLADANSLATAGSYPEAVKSFRDLYTGLNGLAVAAKAKKQLSDLLNKPEVKSALAKADQDARDAERNAGASAALAIAQKLQAEKKDEQAWEKFKSIAAEFAGTDAAKLAAEQVTIYNKQHPEFARDAKDSAVNARAKAAITLANSYKESGHTEAARSKYKSVIDNYPNTPYAETARRELQSLGQ